MDEAEKQRRDKADAEERRREQQKRMTEYVKGLEKYEPNRTRTRKRDQ